MYLTPLYAFESSRLNPLLYKRHGYILVMFTRCSKVTHAMLITNQFDGMSGASLTA